MSDRMPSGGQNIFVATGYLLGMNTNGKNGSQKLCTENICGNVFGRKNFKESVKHT